jgi:hypothetical protein
MSNKIIASLTTYGERINTVHLAIETILNQTKKADTIILWLSEDEFNIHTIPENLKNLQIKGLEIKFCKDFKSYKKLIPTLKLYPNDIIVTFDDDIYYKDDVIELLYNSYLNEQNIIHCIRGHKMKFLSDGSLTSYDKWDMCIDSSEASFDIFPTGVGGILYPKNCFYEDICEENLFMKLAPYGDDIWFKAMSLKKMIKSKIVKNDSIGYSKTLNYIGNTQDNALWLRNKDELNGNNQQIKNVFSKYNLFGIFENFNSALYWNKRYENHGNSGAGSYNNLASFKAEIINEFIKKNKIKNVIEFGCGDGNNLGLYMIPNYVGIDISSKAIEICKKKYFNDSSKYFSIISEFYNKPQKSTFELVLSLDVIYHLVEDTVYEQYMYDLFDYAEKFVIIYASNKDEFLISHVKHRQFTDWIDKNASNWKLHSFIPNKYPYDVMNPKETTFADFYIFEKINVE